MPPACLRLLAPTDHPRTLTAPHGRPAHTQRLCVCAGRIFEFVHGEDSSVPLLGPGNLPQVVEALLLAIRDAPHIAEKVQGCLQAVLQAAC